MPIIGFRNHKPKKKSTKFFEGNRCTSCSHKRNNKFKYIKLINMFECTKCGARCDKIKDEVSQEKFNDFLGDIKEDMKEVEEPKEDDYLDKIKNIQVQTGVPKPMLEAGSPEEGE